MRPLDKGEMESLQHCNVSFRETVEVAQGDPDELLLLDGVANARAARALSIMSIVSEKSPLPRSFLAGIAGPSASQPLRRSVYVMCGISMLCQFSQTLGEFSTWFVVEARGFATDSFSALRYYSVCAGITTFLPVVLGPALGYASEVYGVRRVLLAALSVSVVGSLVMTLTDHPVWYAVGVLLGSLQAVRPLRTAYIAAATHPAVRTRAMALQNLCTDNMRLVAILCTKMWGRWAPMSAVLLGAPLDPLTLSLLTAASVTSVNFLLVLVVFREETSQHLVHQAVEFKQYVRTVHPDGRISLADGQQYADRLLGLLCVVAFLHQSSCGFLSVCNLPVLTGHFGLPAEGVANAKLIQDVLPMPAPLLVAALSTRYQDRTLMCSGFGLAAAGMMIFAWPPAASPFQPIIGLTLVYWAQAFFFTALFSVFSKVMGPRCSGARLAALASAAGLGSTCGTLGGPLVGAYGQWTFFIGLAPTFFAILLLANPWCFPLLGCDHPFARQLADQWNADVASAPSFRKISSGPLGFPDPAVPPDSLPLLHRPPTQ